MKQLEWLRRPIQTTSDHPYILLDSGAYSVWRSGAKVNVDKYAGYCATVKDWTLACINMDTIPGAWGARASAQQVEQACHDSFLMWRRLRDSGAHIMPVYHQTDDLEWLHMYIDEGAQYIGISPTDSFAPPIRHQWLIDIHNYMREHWRLNEDVFTHGLGVFSPQAVMPERVGHNTGFWSADASTLIRYVAIKRILIPKTEPEWDPAGRIIGWVPIYTGARGNNHVTVTNIGWDYVRRYIEYHAARLTDEHGTPPEWQYTWGEDGRLLIDDYCTLMSINMILARETMRQSGVRCFVAGQLPHAIWQVAVRERYPYILRSYAVIKETHGNTIKRIYDRTWEKPARRPERDKVVAIAGLFPQLGHSGW